ncbi:MAG: hypothetical protein KJ626_06765 [Verrucomicrobia bacterium]|nr:hypothetical protein [Verrucomicrobiota bacterium]
MTYADMSWFQMFIFCAMGAQTLAMVITLFQAMIAKAAPTRIMALDIVSIHIVSLIIMYSIAAKRALFLDVALALALVAFIGTLALIRYVLLNRQKGEAGDA